MAEPEDWEERKCDGTIAEKMSIVEEWVGKRMCRGMKDSSLHGRGKAVRQSVGFDGSGGEEKEEKDNPD